MAQHRLTAAVEEGGTEATPQGKSRVAQGEDAWMNAVKAAGLGPPRDRSAGQTGVLELPCAQYTELPFRQPHKLFCVDFVSLCETNLTQKGHGADARP